MESEGNNHPSAAMAERKTLVYLARISMEAQRYEETLDAMKIVARMTSVLTPEEMNLISSAYHKVVGVRRASCRVLSSLEKSEELRGDDLKLQHVKEYRAKIEAEISYLCTEIIAIVDDYLVLTSSAGARAAFYQKLKGDFFWVLADVRFGSDRQEAIDKSFRAYESAFTIMDEVLPDHHPVHRRLAWNLKLLDLQSPNTSLGAKYLEAMSEIPWVYSEIPYIPVELVSMIILRRTTKEIASFAVVSKLWNNLIFTQDFSELHFPSHGGERGIMHYCRGDKVLRWIQATRRSEMHRKPTLTRSLLGPNLNGDQRLNAAKLLYSVRGILFFKRGSEGFLINPITNEFLSLPSPQQLKGFSVAYGFAYDSRSSKYKVLRIQKKVAVLYTLGVRAWNQVPYLANVILDDRSVDGITVENCCHFFATTRTPGVEPRKVILAFNWETEKFHELPRGPAVTTMLDLNKSVLGALKGKLTELYYGTGVSEFSVWCQMAYGQAASWLEVARYRQSISPLPHEFLMITFLDDRTLVLKMDDATLVLLYSDYSAGPRIQGGYRCNGLWDAVEFQASFFKLDLVEPGFVEKLVAHH